MKQNYKIFIVALVIFLLSITIGIFFIPNENSSKKDHLKADIFKETYHQIGNDNMIFVPRDGE
ncbi:hypothetical protein A2483_04625 [Candidatus Peregrinibacteria bacterium RIFOXYC2_FULL_33_13]|nr:MAG: hypothetical protein UR27_C0009G0003 [Candidatus Peregrinibacteria bacterium GW2011_GWA2_33_10]KKP41268.1 MAG: hypothetical protein UR30_C0001G0115 [Candidatus Peregrinibacteria bacterium GW2011_GWC2_33_13]OGJ48978.1 MAG: hypothetical protein A2229_00905 [Candidatus Peregrinibacteria bacterium RIFOXYA2_FULL_33_7]OGJ54489.1 MAG: hypothetical protein A2483_04625 [Candidatus Peregrinibacteria bacterium RIFOXYC2_FULL_33_13]